MNITKFENLQKMVDNYRVLIVEDDTVIREQLQRILQKVFKNISVAVDGQDGFNRYKKGDINLIISDINMPHIDGFRMVEMIRQENSEIPILFLSAYSENNYFMKSIKLGVDGYLLKPIDINQLLEAITKAISKLQLKDDVKRSLNFLHQYQEITDKSTIISKADPKGNITYVNEKFCEISGYTQEELLGKPQSIVRHPKNSPLLFKEMWKTIKDEKKIWNGIVRNITKDGDSYYVDSVIKPILDVDGEILEYISLRNDVTAIMSPKRLLSDFINSCSEPMVAMVKIEYFDDIEKYYGLNTSEEIEKKFQEEFEKILPKECKFEHIYSLGEGVFALALDKKEYNFSTQSMIEHLKQLQKETKEIELSIGELRYDVSVVMSISDTKDALSDVKYGIKKLQESQHKFIVANGLRDKEHNLAQNNLQTLRMVKEAIDGKNIVSHFQPIINNKTQKIEKYESLVRLIDARKQVLSPFFFLDTAKKGQYYSQITSIVLENSFKALDMTDVDISINISILDIEKESTRKQIFALLDRYKKDLHRVVFELLEDEIVKDFDLVKTFIDEVKKRGVKIAIDDFGAGYSNFERLLDYQPDILKIDGSLVKNIETNSLSLHIVETLTAFAKKENIKTIAEYVESKNIYDILNNLGVDYSQGYYFGKPEVLSESLSA